MWARDGASLNVVPTAIEFRCAWLALSRGVLKGVLHWIGTHLVLSLIVGTLYGTHRRCVQRSAGIVNGWTPFWLDDDVISETDPPPPVVKKR